MRHTRTSLGLSLDTNQMARAADVITGEAHPFGLVVQCFLVLTDERVMALLGPVYRREFNHAHQNVRACNVNHGPRDF
jgi:hypothetical protein